MTDDAEDTPTASASEKALPPASVTTDGLPSGVSLFYGAARWSEASRTALAWRFTEGFDPAARGLAVEAAEAWNRQQGGLRFVQNGGDIESFSPLGCGTAQQRSALHWGRLDGPGDELAITYTCVRASSGEGVSFQIVLDRDESWHVGGGAVRQGSYDLLGVLTHEFGHATLWDGHYDLEAPDCAQTVRPLMCPRLEFGSDAWRTVGDIDRSHFLTAYP